MALEPEVETLSSRYLWIERNGETILVSYKLSQATTLGSKIREKDLRRRIKARLQRWSPQKIKDTGEIVTACWKTADIERVKSAVSYVDQMLDAFRKERVIPKIVEEVLGISARERRRWIKDGRLATSGTGQFKKGKTIFQFYLTGWTILRGLLRIQRSSLNGVRRTPKRWIDSSSGSILSY